MAPSILTLSETGMTVPFSDIDRLETRQI